MVLRKSEEQPGLVPAPLSKANPPYPTTPSEENPPVLPSSSADAVYSPDLHKSPAFNFKTLDEAKAPKNAIEKQDIDSDFSDDEWNQSDDDFEDVDPKEVPSVLKPAGGKAPATSSHSSIPDALRAGPPQGVPIKRSLENISPMPTGASAASYGAISNASEQSNGSIPLQTNNPYLKMQPTGQSNWGESSQAIWGDAQSQGHKFEKYDEPVELPANQTPITGPHEADKLRLDSAAPYQQRSHSIDQPPLIAVDAPTPQSEQPRDSIVSNPWEPGTDVSSLDAASRGYGLPEDHTQNRNHQSWQDQQAWEQSERERRQQEAHAAQQAAIRAEEERKHEEEFHRLEQQSQMPQRPPPQVPVALEEQAPALPPRRSHEEQPPTMPPRPLDTGVGSSIAPGPESPNTTMNRQRKEHYQIKHIRWYDFNKKGIRTSPILTQNLNGPCPLLALVNALVLSTPAGVNTALVETLRTRETVSLGLLLDAVFDELMSGRRGDAAQALPDVSELYKFLLALHTGLNVNPMFVADQAARSGNTSLTNRAGGFENTQDMKLYRTFDIPLMHGWLPQAGSEAYTAFDRVAKSYETSQYVQFQEEELDAKLQSGEPLTAEEQQMFTDIHAIKEFLNRWPTQLTDHGLKVMRDTLNDGQVGILFRNDHFSTLCKDPHTGGLVTLVTDQGYSSHDEIVWESLNDANGQGSQLFSGDFRSVDNSSGASRTQELEQVQNFIDANETQGWTTVQGRRGNQQSSTQNTSALTEPTSPGGLSRAEQEDHDLALALQLQEEEEDRQRRETEQRNHQLSMNAIAANSTPQPGPNRRASRTEQAPVIPPRRNNITTHRPANEAAPPPTYEEASTAPRYNPPPGHPASAQAPFPPQGSAYQANAAGVQPPPPNPGMGNRRNSGRTMPNPGMGMPMRPGRRQSAGPGGMVGGPGQGHGQQHEERDKCVVM